MVLAPTPCPVAAAVRCRQPRGDNWDRTVEELGCTDEAGDVQAQLARVANHIALATRGASMDSMDGEEDSAAQAGPQDCRCCHTRHCHTRHELPTTAALSESGSEVALCIYDFHELTKKLWIPVYHLTVEIYGKECFFSTQGVFRTKPPRSGCPNFELYRHKIPLGQTQLNLSQVTQLVRNLRREWPAKAYNMMGPNCQSFAVELVQKLGVAGTVPPQYLAFADVGGVPRSVAAALSGLGQGSLGSPASVGGASRVKRPRPASATKLAKASPAKATLVIV